MAHSPAETTLTLHPAAASPDGETENDAVVGRSGSGRRAA